ncbi:MAG: SAM-dependent methyltransferase, partial [Flavobacteriales bacterium]|nr:SAM-dependent methyltransferase [Flavobacteriales bacterium]
MSILQTAERSSHLDPSENVIFQRHLIAYKEAAKIISGTVLEIG